MTQDDVSELRRVLQKVIRQEFDEGGFPVNLACAIHAEAIRLWGLCACVEVAEALREDARTSPAAAKAYARLFGVTPDGTPVG